MFTSNTGIQFGQIQFFFQYGSCISAVIRELKPYSSTCTCQDHFGISTHALDDMNKYSGKFKGGKGGANAPPLAVSIVFLCT